MKDVAVLAGVHQTTVSLALRNNPEIPEKTRDRIRACAEKIGYHPDPALDAFNFHRLANHPLRSAPAIAFISDLASVEEFEQSAGRRSAYLGAKEAATRMGFVLDRFFVGPGNLPPSRLNSILCSRNVDCVIVGSLSLETTCLPLDWPRLCGLKIESFHVEPQLDIISTNHTQASRLAVAKLWSFGFRRIGLVLSREEDVRLAKLAQAGYLVELTERTGSAPLAPFYLEAVNPPGLAASLAAWISERSIDAIVSDSSRILSIMQRTGHEIPGDLGFATLDWTDADDGFAGVEPDHYLVGQSAVELLAIRRQTNERGVRQQISVTFVPGVWRDGATLAGSFASAYDEEAIGPAPDGTLLAAAGPC